MKARPLVLSVDDDEAAHFFVQHAFEQCQANVELRALPDGRDAINYLYNHDSQKCPVPDLVLLDLNMTHVSGLKVLEHLRKHPLPGNVPILVLSSSTNPAEVKKAYELGCYAYVVKPTDLSKFVDFVCALALEFFGAVPATAPKHKLKSFFLSPTNFN